MGKWIVAGVAGIVASVVGVIFVFCNVSNLETPAGYVGYVQKEPIFGETRFVNLQVGHTSTGLMWRPKVINVSVTPTNIEESFTGQEGVVAQDNVKVEYVVHVVLQIRASDVRQFVEQYTTLLAADQKKGETKTPEQSAIDGFVLKAYENNFKYPIRGFAREEVEKYAGLEIKDHLAAIGTDLETRTRELLKGTPFDLKSINVGSVQAPQSIRDVVAGRLAKTQTLKAKLTEVEIAKKDKQKRLADARGVAAAMDKLNEELTDEYILHEAIEAQRRMTAAPNHSTLYLPQGVNILVTPPAGK